MVNSKPEIKLEYFEIADSKNLTILDNVDKAAFAHFVHCRICWRNQIDRQYVFRLMFDKRLDKINTRIA